MKRFLSIPLLVLILFSGININVASHYCGGKLAGTKVSLTGENATCGMEEPVVSYTPNGSITKHCCDNMIVSMSMAINFFPSANLTVPDNGSEINLIYIEPGSRSGENLSLLSYLSFIIRPPGSFIPNDVEQHSICLFRI
jgi:hypothetical protein